MVTAGMRDQKNDPARKARLRCAAAGLIALALVAASAAQRRDDRRRARSRPISTTPTSTRSAPRCAPTTKYMPQANAGYLPTVHGERQRRRVGHLLARTSAPRPGSRRIGTAAARLRRHRFRRACSTAIRPSTPCGSAESQVLGQREQLRYTEQNTLLNALTYYMNVMRDTARSTSIAAMSRC